MGPIYTYSVVRVGGGIHWWPAGAEEELAFLAGAEPEILAPPLPAVWAAGLARRLARGKGEGPAPRPWSGIFRRLAGGLPRRGAGPSAEALRRQAGRYVAELARSGLKIGVGLFHPGYGAGAGLPWSEGELKQLTAGRRLSPAEVYRRALRLYRLPYGDRRPPEELARLELALFRLHWRGWGVVRPGVSWELDERLRCSRCGSEDMAAWPCSRCGQRCVQCRVCVSLGVVRGCDVLFEGAEGPGPDQGGTSGQAGPAHRRMPGPPVALSPAQEGAARELAGFLAGPQREALLWAACGAGKTEVAFEAVRAVVARGGRVLFAVPRRDVVAELGERLGRYMAPVPVEVLYGGAPARMAFPAAAGPGDTGGDRGGGRRRAGAGRAPLVVATTHQCLRLGPVFDLVILDEVDAYPYRTEAFLRRAIAGTLRPGGKFITMTATPEGPHLRRARRGDPFLVTIPARHHGHPLPVPRWVRDPRMALERLGAPGDGPLGKATLQALRQCLERGPTIAFVPTVRSAEGFGRLLAAKAPGLKVGRVGVPRVAWVHSRDPERDGKIAAFRTGGVDLLVATTVLERGITVPSAQVLVCFADEETVFDARTLVQMAGRAGRSAGDPGGHVFFTSRRRTLAMDEAVAQVREMNGRAQRAGYLRGSGQEGAS